MNNFLLSMIICLDKNSPPVQYYEELLKDFTDGLGYHLQIDGNPFEYKDIEKFLKICNDLNITDIGIRTDEKMNEKNIKIVKQYNCRSIMYRYGNKYLKNNLLIAKNNNVNIEISLILSKENIDQIDEIIRWCTQNEINLLVLERSIIAKYRNKKIKALDNNQYKSIMEKIVEHNSTSNGTKIALSHCPNKILLHKEREYSKEIGGCSAGIISCAINTNGDIIPCLPLYKITLGNIKNDKIAQIWNSSIIFSELRDRNNLKGKCGKCKYKNSCGGCRAEAFYKTSDLFGEDNTCWNEI